MVSPIPRRLEQPYIVCQIYIGPGQLVENKRPGNLYGITSIPEGPVSILQPRHSTPYWVHLYTNKLSAMIYS